jgi:hypothetical protein
MAEAQAQALAFFHVQKTNASRLPLKIPNPYSQPKCVTPKQTPMFARSQEMGRACTKARKQAGPSSRAQTALTSFCESNVPEMVGLVAI